MATATKDFTEAELAKRAEKLAAKEAEAARTDETRGDGIIDRVLKMIDAYVDKLDEEDKARTKALLAPSDASKEVIHASWDAAADVTNAYKDARTLRLTDPAAADRDMDKAVAHFAALRKEQPEVYAGAMTVLYIQAEQMRANEK